MKREWLLKDPVIGYKLTRKEVIKEFLVTEELEAIAAKNLLLNGSLLFVTFFYLAVIPDLLMQMFKN